jgi:RNA-directed DNA polymerase
MDFSQFETIFRYKARVSGYSEENIVSCLNYARPLIEKNFPVIFNTSNLAALVGYKTLYLKRAALHTNYFYRSFTIKKSNGKARILKEPLPSLKEIQVWILQNILYNTNIPISKYAKAYVKKKNLIENVKYHKSKEKVLTLDISNFFGSIERISIEKIFRTLGYSSNIANLLSKLCCCDNCLPQGAPTSPTLSNIVFPTKLNILDMQMI